METAKTERLSYLNYFVKNISSLIFPHHCALCGKPLEEGYFCEDCCKKLPFIEGNTCSVCGCELIDGSEMCDECTNSMHYFYKNISVFKYTSEFSTMVYRFKYHKDRHLARPFAEFMAEKIKKANFPVDFIIPVPLHPEKEEERGYNQSFLLARHISKILDIPVLNDVLVRDIYTNSQTGLKKDRRRENVCGAFSVKNRLAVDSKIILLIDDILTTGSTMDECSRVLLDNGVKRVYSATLATGR
ncbi:MAG: ComF family protein [Thermoanaerobacteraceae bacterium]|nr:ComF family protein [Thermoanaerobacteraceae bacterium]